MECDHSNNRTAVEFTHMTEKMKEINVAPVLIKHTPSSGQLTV